jgi:putative DNA primase/helicase
MNLDEFIDRVHLEGVRKQGGGYLARCPAHEDRIPSLSIGEGDDGRVLLHCWAGCETRDVVAALRLTWRDLFPSQHHRRWQR